MTLQLNPDTTDDYESKSLAQMRQMVFDGLGFITPFTATDANYRENLKNMRVAIVNRLGLAVALLVGGDSFATVLTNVYNACGFAALGTHPPGVDTLLTDFINQAQQMLFRRIELDKGQATLPVAGTISIDSALVQSAAIALAKAHYGQPDAQAYGQQAEKYLSDLTQRTPPNIVGQINSALIGAHNSVFRRYEMNGLTLTASNRGSPATSQDIFGALIKFANDYTLTTADGDLPQVDDYPVRLLALANLKTKIGQPDAKLLYDEYEQYMSDVFRRLPPNATSIVNNQLKITQQTLYRKYDVFRMERWWTWSLIAGQRFYGTFGDDNAKSIAPTGLTATAGPAGAVIVHNLSHNHANGTVLSIGSDKILVAGGSDGVGVTAIAEIFDESAGQFSLTGSLNQARSLQASTILADGRVMVIGGTNGAALNTVEIYDPTTGLFTYTGSLTTARFNASAITLADGRVLVTGGENSSGILQSGEVWDINTGVFASAGTMQHPRTEHSSTLLATGDVLIVGGIISGSTGTATAELFTTASVFAATGSMAAIRSLHSAVRMTNGKVLVAGGITSGFTASDTAEIFDPAAATFSNASGTMTNGRYRFSAAVLQDGNVLLAGGVGASAPTNTADIYDPVADTFTPTLGTMPTAVAETGTVVMPDGRVLIPGGIDASFSAMNTAMFYDPTVGLFYATGSLTQGTVYYQVTAQTANGESLPSLEASVVGVPANTEVLLTWTPVDNQPFVKWFGIYGRVSGGAKQFIARVPANQAVDPLTGDLHYYYDLGTIPPDGALPLINNTQGPGSIDPRHVTWVGLSFNDNVWNPLIKGIPPMAFGQNINGVPTNYEIRQALEIWPAPTTTDWKVQIKGYFEPQVFESDDDETTLDWQAIYLQTLADAMPRFRNQKGQPWFNQLEIAQATANAMQYIKRLVAGTHMTARYVPGVILERNAVRPVLVGPYVGYP